MRAAQPLTGRQRIFVETYALTGRARQSAIAAGCNPSSAAVRANRWLKKREIRNSVGVIRDIAFEKVRNQIAKQVISEIEFALTHGLSLPRTQRAHRLLYRLGFYKFDPFASERKSRRKRPDQDQAQEHREKLELVRRWQKDHAGEQAGMSAGNPV